MPERTVAEAWEPVLGAIPDGLAAASADLEPEAAAAGLDEGVGDETEDSG